MGLKILISPVEHELKIPKTKAFSNKEDLVYRFVPGKPVYKVPEDIAENYSKTYPEKYQIISIDEAAEMEGILEEKTILDIQQSEQKKIINDGDFEAPDPIVDDFNPIIWLDENVPITEAKLLALDKEKLFKMGDKVKAAGINILSTQKEMVKLILQKLPEALFEDPTLKAKMEAEEDARMNFPTLEELGKLTDEEVWKIARDNKIPNLPAVTGREKLNHRVYNYLKEKALNGR